MRGFVMYIHIANEYYTMCLNGAGNGAGENTTHYKWIRLFVCVFFFLFFSGCGFGHFKFSEVNAESSAFH